MKKTILRWEEASVPRRYESKSIKAESQLILLVVLVTRSSLIYYIKRSLNPSPTGFSRRNTSFYSVFSFICACWFYFFNLISFMLWVHQITDIRNMDLCLLPEPHGRRAHWGVQYYHAPPRVTVKAHPHIIATSSCAQSPDHPLLVLYHNLKIREGGSLNPLSCVTSATHRIPTLNFSRPHVKVWWWSDRRSLLMAYSTGAAISGFLLLGMSVNLLDQCSTTK